MRTRASRFIISAVVLAFLISTVLHGQIFVKTALAPTPLRPLKPADYLALLPILEDLKNREAGDPQLLKDLAEFSAALAAFCERGSLQAEKKMLQLLGETRNGILRSLVFSLLLRAYRHRGAWPEMQAFIEGQGDQIKTFYAGDMAEWALLPKEGFDIPQHKAILPLTVKNGLPLLKASVNGKEGIFLIDTGASRSMITSQFAEECGVSSLAIKSVKIPAYMVQRKKSQIAILSELRIGSIRINKSLALVMSSLLYSFNMPKIDGILGWNVLHHFRMEMDFKRTMVSLSRPSEEPVPNRNFFWLGYPLVRLQTKSGQDVYLELDTGAYRTLFTNHLEKRGVIKTADKKIVDHWGPVEAGGASYLWLGSRLDLVLDRFIIMLQKPFVKKNLQISDWVRIDGLLGCDVLRLEAFVIDEQAGVFEFLAASAATTKPRG